MTKTPILDAIRDAIQEIDPHITRDHVQTDTDLLQDLGLFEIELIELILTLEEKFSIEIDDTDIPTLGVPIQRVADWIERIEQIQNKQNNKHRN